MEECEFCKGKYGKSINVIKSPLSEETQPNKVQIVQLENDTPGIILYRHGLAQGCLDIKYCPICGRKLSEESKLLLKEYKE